MPFPVFYLNKVNIVPKFQKDVPFGRLWKVSFCLYEMLFVILYTVKGKTDFFVF